MTSARAHGDLTDDLQCPYLPHCSCNRLTLIRSSVQLYACLPAIAPPAWADRDKSPKQALPKHFIKSVLERARGQVPKKWLRAMVAASHLPSHNSTPEELEQLYAGTAAAYG